MKCSKGSKQSEHLYSDLHAVAPNSLIDSFIMSSYWRPERDSREVSHISGLLDNKIQSVKISPSSTETKNFAFDVTPAKYISGLITPRGITKANETDINKLYPEF